MRLRYVDDTFVVWEHGQEQLERFQEHLNQNESIQFTKEEESEGVISFLDVRVKRNEDGSLTTGVFRKKTHRDRYIHYDSHHHKRVKIGTISCLRCRMDRECDETSRNKEISHLKTTFRANGYPPDLISRILRQQPRPQTVVDTTQQTSERPRTFSLPYVQGVSERIERVCRGLNVRLVLSLVAHSDNSWSE